MDILNCLGSGYLEDDGDILNCLGSGYLEGYVGYIELFRA